MKKIIAMILVATLSLLALASCGGGSDELTTVATMYANSAPTKVVSTTTQEFSHFSLTTVKKLTMGSVAGDEAAMYDVTAEQLRSVEAGGETEKIESLIETVREITVFVEGKGTKKVDPETGTATGAWKKDGVLATPEKGDIAINLDPSIIKEYTYENNELSFVVPAANTGTVLGIKVSSDVTVKIVDEGAVVRQIELSYNVAADAENNVSASTVTIKVEYTYDLEKISF